MNAYVTAALSAKKNGNKPLEPPEVTSSHRITRKPRAREPVTSNSPFAHLISLPQSRISPTSGFAARPATALFEAQ
jgi:hypothetical protein